MSGHTPPPDRSARATRAMVAAPHALAAAAGVDALRRGGSAVDAAIAVDAVLCVVYPHWAGLGGDGFWMIAEPGGGAPLGINASGPAAALATRALYQERGHGEVIPARGALAALTVPGMVDGWRLAHERFGRLGWAELLADAVHLARHGFPVAGSLSYWAARHQGEIAAHRALAEWILPGGVPPREGARLAAPRLADTLGRIARHGPRELYEGEVAGRMGSALGRAGSPLRAEDLGRYRAEWVEPISTTYRGHTVWELPPNTQGFAALQILNLLEGVDVQALGDGTVAYYHLLAEAVKVAFADRDAWLSDPRFVRIPLERLISREYAEERRPLVRRERAAPIQGVAPGIAYPGATRRPRDGQADTVYHCVVDQDGLMVSVIASLYKDFGSMTLAGDTGVLLQNRGAYFTLGETEANRLEPGKRSAHTLIPAMMYRDGRAALAFGTMGGNGQPQTHAALLTRMVDFGYGVQRAITAPRWAVGPTLGEQDPRLFLEGRIPDRVAHELLRLGHEVRMVMDWEEDMGHAQAIRLDPETGLLEGGADPRGDGVALGY